MIDQQEYKEHFQAFLESASLLAHDMSGQAHVAQFCVEEMRGASSCGGADSKFLERLEESLFELSELSVLYRQFIKDQTPENLTNSFSRAHQSSARALSLHYFKDRERLSFDWDCKLDNIAVDLCAHTLHQILYGLYSLSLEGLKNKQIEASLLKVKLLDFNALDKSYKVLLSNDHGVLEQSYIFQLGQQDNGFAGTAYRRSNSLLYLKKALQGEFDTVKIVFDKNQPEGVVLIIRKASESEGI